MPGPLVCGAWTSRRCYDSASRSLLLKAGRSSGLRLVIKLPSTTTSSSTHVAPAFRMSVCRLGQDVSVRPFNTPASTSDHGAWQIAATGLPDSKKLRMKSTAVLSIRSASGLATPPGQHQHVEVTGFRLADGDVHVEAV